MDVLLFYFSGTGNTKWVQEKLVEVLNERNHHVTVFAIDCISDIQMGSMCDLATKANYIGFAFPIFGANTPRIMRQFIQSFCSCMSEEPLKNKNIFIINTFGYVNGCGLFNTNKFFKASFFSINQYINIRMPNHAYSKKWVYPKFNSIKEKQKHKAIQKINRLVKAMEKNKRVLDGIGPHLLVGILIRLILQEKLEKAYLGMTIDHDVCTRCMQCVYACPTKSIIWEDETFHFLSSCESCMRCYYYCPVHAIGRIES